MIVSLARRPREGASLFVGGFALPGHPLRSLRSASPSLCERDGWIPAFAGMTGSLPLYEPPASCCARCVPLLQKGEGNGVLCFSMDSGLRRNDGMLRGNDVGCAPPLSPVSEYGAGLGHFPRRAEETCYLSALRPPSSRGARRVPLLLCKRGRVRQANSACTR